MKPTNSDLSPQYNTHTHSLSLSLSLLSEIWSDPWLMVTTRCLFLRLLLTFGALFVGYVLLSFSLSLSLSLSPFSSCVEIWWNFFVLMGFLVEIWAVFGFFPAGLRLAKWRSRLGIGLWLGMTILSRPAWPAPPCFAPCGFSPPHKGGGAGMG